MKGYEASWEVNRRPMIGLKSPRMSCRVRGMSRKPNERFERHGEGDGVFRDDFEGVGDGYEVPRERLIGLKVQK